jgi:hypothetical protein
MTRIITAMEARKSFGKIMNLVNLKNEQFIVERNGKPLAAIVPLEMIGYAEEKQVDMGVVVSERKLMDIQGGDLNNIQSVEIITEELDEKWNYDRFEDID